MTQDIVFTQKSQSFMLYHWALLLKNVGKIVNFAIDFR